MVLFWFIIGVIAITLIARYNESDKLFWKLFLAFVLGFACAKMYMHLTTEQNKDSLTQVCPTQASMDLSGIAQFLMSGNGPETTVSVCWVPVSKVYTPAERESGLILSKISGEPRGQPHLFFDTS